MKLNCTERYQPTPFRFLSHILVDKHCKLYILSLQLWIKIYYQQNLCLHKNKCGISTISDTTEMALPCGVQFNHSSIYKTNSEWTIFFFFVVLTTITNFLHVLTYIVCVRVHVSPMTFHEGRNCVYFVCHYIPGPQQNVFLTVDAQIPVK